MIDNVGKHFEVGAVNTFLRYWKSMFSLNPASRIARKARKGTAMRLSSETRQWSKWEVLNLVMQYFGYLEPFLGENENLAPSRRGHLLELFDDPENASDLEIELAAMIDAGPHYVSAKYYLEGDGPLAFSCYERYLHLLMQLLWNLIRTLRQKLTCRLVGM